MLDARKTDGTLLASSTSGDIPFDGFQWRKYQLEFTADASGTIDFIVRNNQQLPGTSGNDIAIDDITIGVGCDFGDAPDTYKTSLASGGPSHKGSANLRMGTLLDIETDGFPSTANGDNLDNINDEDAVTFGVLCTATTSLTALVVDVNNTGSPSARLIGWIDFNQNGTFEASEGVSIPAGTAGNYTLTWTGISGLVPGTTYARVRLTSDPSITVNTPGGSAADGEVEDYQIVINPGGGTITANPTALTVCSGAPVSVSYTTAPTGQVVQWVRMPGGLTGAGDFTDYPTATGSTPVSYTYTAVIPSIYGCPSNIATTVVLVNPVPVITPSVCSQTICVGQTGAITFVSSVTGTTVNWLRVEDGATGTGDISQLFTTAGTYTYKIWGVSSPPATCPSSTTITCTIVVNPTSLSENKTLAICNNVTVDLATYFPAGGSFSALSGSLTGTIFSGIASGVGSYTVAYTPGDVCSAPALAVIVVRDCTPPPCNYPISAGKIDATCGNSDGTASVSIGGLPAGATTGFAWSNGKTGPNITGLAAGVYSVTATITTANGACTVIDSVQVNDIGAPIGEIDLITSADCLGNNGAVAIDITTGTGPFTISWTGAATGSLPGATLGVTTIPNLAPGSYIFKITSSSTNTACSSYLPITIPKDDSDRISVTATPTNATACGSFSGSIVMTAIPAVGVTGPFSYSLNGVEMGVSANTSFTVTGLKAGVYTVGVSSAGGCSSAEIPVTILETGAPAITGWTVVNPVCPADKGQLVFAGGQATATFLVREVTTGAIVSPVAGISGATSTTLTLPAGTYSIESTATSSTCTSFTTVTIVVPEGLKFNVEYTKVTCAPGGVANNDGTVSVVQIMGGTSPYSTTLTNAQNQVIAPSSPGVYTNLAPGVYNVKVFDSKGCSGVESIFVTVPNCEQLCPVIPMNTFVVDANCGASDGRAVAQLGTYSENDVDYQWSNNFSGKNTNGLASGVYSVTATVLTGTFAGCPYVEMVNVNDIGGPVFESRIINPSSCTGATGSVSFSVTSGTGPYVVSWTGPSSGSANLGNTGSGFSFNRTGLAAGNYVFTLTGSTSSCKSTQDVTIPVSSSSAITLAATPNTASSCGSQDGSISLTASGSGPNYTFSLNGTAYTSVSINTLTIPGLPAGVYTVGVVSGANGCETERTVTIGETGAPVVSGWTSQSATCPTDDGTLIFAGGQAANVTYRVLLGSGGTVITTVPGNTSATVNVPKGVYVVERKETVGGSVCTSFQSFTINVPNGIDFNVQYTPESCGPGGTGNGDGTLQVVQINGGTPGYTVTVTDITTGLVASNLQNLGGGDYKVSVTDANGCPGNEDALVTVPPCQIKCPAMTFETTVIDNECGKVNGQATANLLVVPAGATATYLWSNGANGPVASGLAAGTYSVTATVSSADNVYNACKYIETVNVNDIGGPILSLQLATAASCTAANGSAVLNLSGTGPFTISWTGPTTGNQTQPSAAPVTISGLKSGNYVFTLTGNGTCKSVLDVTIPSNSTTVINATAVATNATSCGANDGRIVITVTGGVGPFTYSLNGYIEGVSNVRTFTRTGLPAGTYQITVTDANGCSVTKTNVIINPVGQPAIAGWTKTDANCPDENGTIQYTNPGTDAGATYVVTIANTATIMGQATAGTPLSLTVPGGTYVITRTTSTSCVSVTTITVNQPTGMDFNIQYKNPTCLSPTSGSLTVVQPSGGTGTAYSYTITGPTGVVGSGGTAANLAPGSYTVTMGDGRSCTLSDVVTLTNGSNLTVVAGATPAAVCAGGSLALSSTVTPAGSYTFAWSGPGGFTSNLQNPTVSNVTLAGSYTVVVTDATNCATTAVTSVVSLSVCCDLAATAVPTAVTSCVTPNSGAVVLTYTGSQTYQYSVNGGAFQSLGASPFTVPNLAAGTYTIVVQAVGDPSCMQSLTATVNSPVLPTVQATSNSPLCAGSTIALAATGGFTTYAWSGPNGFVSNQQNPTIPNATTITSGTYSVTATNAAGCTALASTTVTIATQPSLSITAGSGLTICSGQSTTLAVSGDGGAAVTWVNSLGQSGTGTSIVFAGIGNVSGQPETVTYVFSAKAGDCSDSKIVTLTINPAPALQVVPQNAVICALEMTNIVATTNPATATINWTRTPAVPTPASGTGTGSVTVNEALPAGNYTYNFTATQNGCTSPVVTVPLTVQN
ncbi:GEVED domain-containing protein [Larkinella sp. GY13]